MSRFPYRADPDRRPPSRARGFTAFELLTVLAIVGMLNAIAVAAYRTLPVRARFSEVLLLATPLRIAVHEHLAVFGTWPASGDLPLADLATLGGRHARPTSVEDGVITWELNASPEALAAVLSFQPAVDRGEVPATLLWICARAPVPDGFVAHGTNRSDVRDVHLPAPCRAGRVTGGAVE